jgi:type II secretory pathway pseudopilin PulG
MTAGMTAARLCLRGARDRARTSRIVQGRLALRDDSGSSLIIALLFIIVVAITITALLTFAGGALLNTANLRTQRSREYAADTGTDLAIQAVRYGSSAYDTITGTPLTPPRKCFGPATLSTSGPSTPSPTSNKWTVVVYCQGTQVLPLAHSGPAGAVAHISQGATTVTTPTLFVGGTTKYVGFKLLDSSGAFPTSDTAIITSPPTSGGTVTLSAGAVKQATNDTLTVTPVFERTVTFFTCVAKGTTTPAACPTATHKPDYVVHAVVAFDDVTPTDHRALCGSFTGNPTCGTAMSVKQWVVQPANG